MNAGKRVRNTRRGKGCTTISPSLFAEVLIPDPEVIPDWVQPESTNPYMKGDKVRHNGKVWISDIDFNVFEPGIAGWSEIE